MRENGGSPSYQGLYKMRSGKGIWRTVPLAVSITATSPDSRSPEATPVRGKYKIRIVAGADAPHHFTFAVSGSSNQMRDPG
jgi:hypothetical protein